MQAPHWSPDGRSLTYTQSGPGGRAAVRVVDTTGADREVAAPGGVVMFAAWSPDGRRIAFQREKDRPREIWAVSADGGDAAALSKSDVELSHPEWCPTDPDKVLVVVDHKNLATVSAASGAVTPVTHYDDSTVYVDYPMGEVWRARDTTLDREVAIKVLPDDVARDPERIARFEREAQVLASLNHPNIAAIYGLDESRGRSLPRARARRGRGPRRSA